MKIPKKEKRKILKNILKSDNINKIASKCRDIFSEVTDIPQYALSGVTKITTIDNKNTLIEGYKNIVDYYSHYIKISGNSIGIVIDGKNLDIKEITDEDLVITGEIYSINFKNN